MTSITEMTLEAYRRQTGKVLGYDDIYIIKAIDAAIEKRLKLIQAPALSDAQMSALNEQKIIG